MTFIFKKGQYFGTFQNRIEDKKSETEGIYSKLEHIHNSIIINACTQFWVYILSYMHADYIYGTL